MTLNNDEIALMQAEVVRTLLDHTCTIMRDSNVTSDDWGNKGPELLTPYLEDQACHYWITSASKRPQANGSPDAVIDSINLELPAEIDVNENDVIAAVYDRNGAQITGQLRIREVRKRINHVHLILFEVR